MERQTPPEIDLDDPTLTERDLPWLRQLTGSVKTPPLEVLNEYIAEGSMRLNKHEDREVAGDVLAARVQFFESLGWANPKHPLNEAYTDACARVPTLMPLSNFVAAQRAFQAYHVNPLKVYKQAASSLARMHGKDMRRQLTMLHELGIHVSEVLEQDMRALGANRDTIELRLDLMQGLGIEDPVHVMNEVPYFIIAPPDKISRTIEFFRGIEVTNPKGEKKPLDINKIAHSFPNAFAYDPVTVALKMDEWRDLGLNAEKILSYSPANAGQKVDTIKAKLDNLSALGLPAADVVNKFPSVLNANPATLRRHFRYMQGVAHITSWQGDVVQLLSAHPNLLIQSDDKLRFMAALAFDALPQAEQKINEGQVANSIMLPAEYHMMATMHGGGYSRATARAFRDQVNKRGKPTVDMRVAVLKNLRDPEARALIGKRILRAYMRYKPLKPQEERQFPDLADEFMSL